MRARSTLLLIAPAVLTIGIFMLIPMFIALAYSFMTANPYGGVLRPFTFDAYIQFLLGRQFFIRGNLDGFRRYAAQPILQGR